MNYADKLRAFADYLEQRPELLDSISAWDSPSLTHYCEDAVDFGSKVALAGKGRKDGYQGSLSYWVAPNVDGSDSQYGDKIYSFTLTVSGVCEKKETGKVNTRTIHIPEGARLENGQWVVDEPEYEYDCPKSFLSLAD